MAQRLPKQMIVTELTTTGNSYAAPTNTRTTISAATVVNKTATPRYVTAQITPSGGSAINAVYQFVVPAAGAAPTVLYGLVGQTIMPGGELELIAEANSALDCLVSGYETSGS